MAQRSMRETLEHQGIRIARYEVIRRIAIGGMAEIFLARDLSIGGASRTVVLKCILPSIGSDPSFVELFFDEARIAARLSHQNIAHVYDFGEADGQCYIAMEYIDGLHVSQLVRGLYPELMPVEHAVKIGSLVADALFHAHNITDAEGRRLGIIHRDVSPENIMVSLDGQVKLVDFGIARAADQVHHTQVGVLRGKAAYLSPEQCVGQPFDHRVDIFSLGTVLHEMLCGRRLFKRESDFRTMQAVCKGSVPRPSEVRPGVSRHLDEIILRALSRNADHRYQEADELGAELERVMHEEHLVSTQVQLGLLARTVLSRGDHLRDTISGAEGGEAPAERTDSQSGVRVAAERAVGRPRTDPTADARGGRRAQASGLAFDLREALGELSSEHSLAAPDTARDGKPKQRLFELDVDDSLLSPESSLSDSLVEVDADETIVDSPTTIPRGRTKREAAARRRRGRRDVHGTPGPTLEIPGSRARSGRSLDDVPTAPEDLAAPGSSRPGQAPVASIRMVQPVAIGAISRQELVAPPQAAMEPEAPSGPRAVRDEGVDGVEIVVISDEPNPEDALIDLSVVDEATDGGFDEAETNVWTAKKGSVPVPQRGPTARAAASRRDLGAPSEIPADLENRLTDEIRPDHGRRWLAIAVASLLLIAAVATVAVLWPGRGREDERAPARDEATSKTVSDAAPRDAPGRSVPVPVPPAPLPGGDGSLVLHVADNDSVIVDERIVAVAAARAGVALAEGEHAVRVIRPRHRTWAKRLRVTSGGQLTVTPRPKRASLRWGRLSVTSEVEADVYVAGILLGRTPLTETVLWPGPYEVRLVADDRRESRLKATVARGRDTALAATARTYAAVKAIKRSRPLRGPLADKAAVARARTCFENADYGCCADALGRLEKSAGTVNLQLTCLDAAGRREDACALAKRQARLRTASQFIQARCRP